MKKTALMITIATFAASSLVGCANMTETQSDTAKGAGIGAVAGAVIGAATGGRKGAAAGAAIGAAAGAGGGFLWAQGMQEQRAAMEQATQGSGVTVTQTQDNQLKLEIPSDISFDSGSYQIKSSLRPILDRFATTLNQNPATTVRIIGHTDNRGSDAVNNPLSVNRADATRDYLVTRGVLLSRFGNDGRGSREPTATNSTEAGRAQNRRVEIFVAEAAP